MKQCRKCKETKPTEDYYKSSSMTIDGLRHECKACWKKACKKYFTKNKQHLKVKQRDYHYKSEYGISFLDFEEMKKSADYKCESCGQEKTLVLDHCHSSGGIRGVLCNPCNQALGSLYDNEDYILGLLAYLRKNACKTN